MPFKKRDGCFGPELEFEPDCRMPNPGELKRGNTYPLDTYEEDFNDILPADGLRASDIRIEAINELSSTIQKLVETEVSHHEKVLGTSGNGPDWERGFIDGLKHVIRIIPQIADIIKE